MYTWKNIHGHLSPELCVMCDMWRVMCGVCRLQGEEMKVLVGVSCVLVFVALTLQILLTIPSE